MTAAPQQLPHALEIDRLTLIAGDPAKPLVDDASMIVRRGEVHALVGESGSGKTLLSQSAIGLLPAAIRRQSGAIRVAGTDVTLYDQQQWRALRGSRIGMVFQEPMVSLNPAMKIGQQMTEAYQLHNQADQREARQKAVEMLDLFKVSRAAERLAQYPHEFSGGMRQRILLAAVMMLEPDLLLADEPTTALDAVVQKDVLDTMVTATGQYGTAVLLVTHDLGVVSRYATHVTVINQGKIEESRPTGELLSQPEAEYTKHLIASSPANRPAPDHDTQHDPVLEVRDLLVEFALPRKKLLQPPEKVAAVAGVSFQLHRGEMLGLVGESGSGKSTIGRSVLGLIPHASGRVMFDGREILAMPETERRKLRPRMQLIFQDPYSALNPRKRIGVSVEAALLHLPPVERRRKAAEMLEITGLGRQFFDRFPHELSGGQRQRVCIARALASDPDFVVADEAVSALDVSVQAQILDLLARLQEERNFACLFISHDLDVVRAICTRTIVLKDGKIVEEAGTKTLLSSPQLAYTRSLIDAFPSLTST